MIPTSKGTTCTIDFSANEPREMGFIWPDEETKNQTDQAVQKFIK